jgi:hypothetical protein
MKKMLIRSGQPFTNEKEALKEGWPGDSLVTL